MLGIAQVTGTIQGVHARGGQTGRIADVVQPRRCFHKIGISAENGHRQAACPRGDALDVRPAAGQDLLQEGLGEMFGP